MKMVSTRTSDAAAVVGRRQRNGAAGWSLCSSPGPAGGLPIPNGRAREELRTLETVL